jgi:hypothetical protein
MKKKTMTQIGIFAVVVVAIFGIGFASAYNAGHFGTGFFKFGDSKNLTKTEIQQMKDFNSQVQTAIQNNDYATWKSLMESQLTQDNFNNLVTNYQKMSQMINQTGGFKEHISGNFTGNFTGSFKMRNMHGPKPSR